MSEGIERALLAEIEAMEARLEALRAAYAALTETTMHSAPRVVDKPPAKRKAPKPGTRRGRYSNDEKNHAVDRAVELRSGTAAAEELGCKPELIDKWRGEGFGSGLGIPGAELPADVAMELVQ
jgi:hypothetical protein